MSILHSSAKHRSSTCPRRPLIKQVCALTRQVSSFVERKVRFSMGYAGIGQFQTSAAFGIGVFDCNSHRNPSCTRLLSSFAGFGLENSSQRVLETVLFKLRACIGRFGPRPRDAGLEFCGLWVRWKHQLKHRLTSPLTIRFKSVPRLSFLAFNTLWLCFRSIRIHGTN